MMIPVKTDEREAATIARPRTKARWILWFNKKLITVIVPPNKREVAKMIENCFEK